MIRTLTNKVYALTAWLRTITKRLSTHTKRLRALAATFYTLTKGVRALVTWLRTITKRLRTLTKRLRALAAIFCALTKGLRTLVTWLRTLTKRMLAFITLLREFVKRLYSPVAVLLKSTNSRLHLKRLSRVEKPVAYLLVAVSNSNGYGMLTEAAPMLDFLPWL